MRSRHILITGGSNRVGAEIARLMHDTGANLMIHYRSSAKEARALQGWLDRLPPSNDPANRAEADAGRLDLSRLKAEIRALESPRFSIPLGLVAAATEGERALSAFLAHGFPLLAIVQAGQGILSKAESLLMAGYAEFSQLDASGFSKATTGSPSAVASYSPPVTEAMPSAGSK